MVLAKTNYTKSQVAFLMSAQMLFEAYPHHMYFWTLTFKRVYPDWFYPNIFHLFWVEIREKVIGPYHLGLRVIEPHPGGHGLHYHLLINKRIPKGLLDRIAERHGMGITWVEKCDFGAAVYLSKYLSKDKTPLFGVRRWHTLGCFRGVRTNDIEIHNPYMRARREVCGKAKVKIGYEKLLMDSFALHGKAGLERCFGFLREGRTSSACMMVNPNIVVTKKGGIKYDPINKRYSRRIPFRCFGKNRGIVTT